MSRGKLGDGVPLVRVQESPRSNCCSLVWLYPVESGFHNQVDNVGAANLQELLRKPGGVLGESVRCTVEKGA
jgi:hypothetical protein